MLTDFAGYAISESSGAQFSAAQIAWLCKQLEAASEAAIVMAASDGPELLAVRLLRYDRMWSPEGALLYKARLDDIEKDRVIRLVARPRPVDSAEDRRPVSVPPAYSTLGLNLVRTEAGQVDYSALPPHFSLILFVVPALAAPALLLGSCLAGCNDRRA